MEELLTLEELIDTVLQKMSERKSISPRILEACFCLKTMVVRMIPSTKVHQQKRFVYRYAIFAYWGIIKSMGLFFAESLDRLQHLFVRNSFSPPSMVTLRNVKTEIYPNRETIVE